MRDLKTDIAAGAPIVVGAQAQDAGFIAEHFSDSLCGHIPQLRQILGRIMPLVHQMILHGAGFYHGLGLQPMLFQLESEEYRQFIASGSWSILWSDCGFSPQ